MPFSKPMTPDSRIKLVLLFSETRHNATRNETILSISKHNHFVALNIKSDT